jgi:hypothetical protein
MSRSALPAHRHEQERRGIGLAGSSHVSRHHAAGAITLVLTRPDVSALRVLMEPFTVRNTGTKRSVAPSLRGLGKPPANPVVQGRLCCAKDDSILHRGNGAATSLDAEGRQPLQVVGAVDAVDAAGAGAVAVDAEGGDAANDIGCPDKVRSA